MVEGRERRDVRSHRAPRPSYQGEYVQLPDAPPPAGQGRTVPIVIREAAQWSWRLLLIGAVVWLANTWKGTQMEMARLRDERALVDGYYDRLTDLLLSREGDGWVLRADSRSRESFDAIREAGPQLAQRFAERNLGTLTIDPHFHG